jgi:DNA ligase-1
VKRFAALFATLDETRATNQKVAAMRRYFSESAPEDAAWGLYFLRGSRLKRLIAPSRIRVWAAQATALSEAVLDESYAHVGDLAETLALLLDTSGRAHDDDTPLSIWVQRLQALREADETAQRAALLQWWQQLPMLQCFLLNKLLTGELRVGVSAGLATRALAESAALLPALVNERLMGDWQPSAEAFRRVIAPVAMAATAPSDIAPRSAQPYPFCLANPLEADPAGLGAIDEFCVEWKWDGIRCQLIRRAGKTFLWSRGEEMLDGRFPEIEALAERLPDGCVLDGEVLAWREGQVLPFALLQKRIGRKQVGAKLLAEAPVALLAYDLLEWRGVDLREQPLARRRAQLETLAADHGLIVSPRVLAAGWSELAQLREGSRERGVEGLMLKRLDSPYRAGRKTGVWWKWKIDPLTFDGVLVYAQSGHGRRSNLYSDYTLAVWDGDALVPVAKAYSGLTDAELIEMDRWIRAHTREKFGPVRSVEPGQVFEIAFEGIAASSRHKSGIAMRFPRIRRWRRDKLAQDADRIETLRALLAQADTKIGDSSVED